MARTDEPIKKLFKNKENFADLFNATIFQGEQVIKADKLIEISTEDIHIDNVSLEKENISDNIQEETEKLEITKKYRDLMMRYEDQVLQIVLGCEDQSTVDYSMPMRTMLYDALAYAKQQNDIELRQNSEGKYYRRKMTKKEKILPVLTIVFYYGEKQWDGATHIHDVIQWSNKLNLKNIVPDYKMNLIWAYGQKDIDKFKSDLQYILYLLKYKQEEDKLEKYIEENDEKLQHMNQDTHNAIIALMGSQILEGIENEEGGEIRMESKALQAIQRRGEIIGRQEGEILKLIVQTKKKIQRGDTQEKIADDLMEEESVIQPIYEAIKQYPDKTKEEIYKMLNL
ncbi:Rpn family recombination-promoting nuclease/putative transposase [Anaerostipes hadrus]|uniref:Rpn family recombination-promoting nuclease/putative transposase n=1 Tax=Anaerostipes hadrus TaxID=649756 RepID=UPI001D009356|nr:Rpn family recombination-promoting nuclease/putative transposase [Anaerostipes hadrus]MCB5543762.1 Rpn family recombination-promoting nuclease/putative transposase [Anaerostipes hadrus]